MPTGGRSAALPAPALPLPLPEERFAARPAAGTLIVLAGDARPALGSPAAALRLATDAPAIPGLSTGGGAAAADEFNAESKAHAGCGATTDAEAAAAAESGAASDAIAGAEAGALKSNKRQYSCHQLMMQSAFIVMYPIKTWLLEHYVSTCCHVHSCVSWPDGIA